MKKFFKINIILVNFNLIEGKSKLLRKLISKKKSQIGKSFFKKQRREKNLRNQINKYVIYYHNMLSNKLNLFQIIKLNKMRLRAKNIGWVVCTKLSY